MTAQPVAATVQPAAANAVVAARCEYPLVGVAAVLLGAFVATLNTRITTFGLADIRGGLSLGFDEGSWLTSVFSAGQMLIAPAAAWLSTVVGARRFLLWSSMIFAVTSLLLPFSDDYTTVIALQLVRGLSVGAFIPAALGFILRSLPPHWWIWGIAAYAFRFVFSQNIASSLEAFYSERGLWQWIFWQNTALAPLLILLIWLGMPRQAVDRELLRRTDWGGIVFAGLGLGMIYAGLDQGNRLDWLNSGVVTGLMAGGGAAGRRLFRQRGGRAVSADPSARAGAAQRVDTGGADRDLRLRIDGDGLRPAGLSDARPGPAGAADRRCAELDRAAAIRHRPAGRARSALGRRAARPRRRLHR